MRETKSKKRLAFVDVYYAIAAVCIVFYHSRMMHTDNMMIITKINSFLTCFQVPLFFFIAGILFSYTYRDDRDWKKWSIDKIVKLYIPYFILCSLAFFTKRIYYTLINANVELSYSSFLVSLIKPANSMWGHLWFIPVYLIMMFLLMIYWRFVKNKTTHALVLCISAFATMFPINCEWLGVRDICIEMFWLLLGAEASNFIIARANETKRTSKVIVLVILGIVLAICLFVIGDMVNLPSFFDRIKVKAIAAIMICTVLLASIYISGEGTTEHNKVVSLISYVGRNAFVIYMYGWPFQAVIEAVFSVYLHLPFATVFVMKFIMGILCPLFLVLTYERFFLKNRIIKLLLGK